MFQSDKNSTKNNMSSILGPEIEVNGDTGEVTLVS